MKNYYMRVRRTLLLASLFLIGSSPLFTQNTSPPTVSGTVRDATGPLNGVNVLVQHSNRGTITQLDGTYTLVAQPTDTLLFSYVGYVPQTIPVQNRTVIHVTLTEDETTLDPVVLNAGYYNVTDRERTGSIAKLEADALEDQPVNNPLATLQGRLAGVDVTPSSGVPGSGFTVRIRGQNSLFGGNEPLYIVDGVPFGGANLSELNVSFEVLPEGNVSPLAALDPATIASIEVLKDADATAIYGSRGANGVVLITTKRGTVGETRFRLQAQTGIAQVGRYTPLLDTPQYLAMRREAFANDGITEYPATAYDVNGTWDPDRYTDWQEVLTGGDAPLQQLSGQLTGGSAETRYLLSGSYQREGTVFAGDFGYDRLRGNASLNHTDANDRFGATLTVGYTVEDNRQPKKDPTLDALFLSPNAPELYDAQGNLNWENSTWTNPLAALRAVYENRIRTLLTQGSLRYRPFTGFEARVNLGYGATQLREHYTSPHTTFDPAFGLDSSASLLIDNVGDTDYHIVEPQLEWEGLVGPGRLKALVGTTFQVNTERKQSFIGVGFANNSFIENLSAATTLIALNETEEIYRYQSLFARLNYSLWDQLYLNVTGRRDGSSRFGPGNRYGNFGAVGTAWVFSEVLDWDWLSLGKVRASYGLTGNDQIGNYRYLSTYAISGNGYDGNLGLQPARLYNPDFQWEENRKAELGLELDMLDHRLNVQLAYYRNRSTNQLVEYALPGTTGFATILDNLDAVVENRGLEVTVGAGLFRTERFSWEVAMNLTVPRTELVAFPGLEASTYADRFVIGKPLSVAKLYHVTGVNPDIGVYDFEDYNGDGVISAPEDRQYVADLSPQLYGGVSNEVRLGNWSVDALLQFMQRDAYGPLYASSPPGTMVNQSVAVLNRWQGAGDSAPLQQYTTGGNPEAVLAHSRFAQSSGVVQDASYLRLKTVALRYAVPVNRGPIASCQVQLRGQNLFVWTPYEGGDPEQTRGYLPPLRRITLGVDLTF